MERAVIVAIAVAVVGAGCGGNTERPPAGTTPRDAGGVVDAAAIDDAQERPDSGAATATSDATVRRGSLPPELRPFGAFLADLEQRPQNAARTKRTCSIIRSDRRRAMFSAVWTVARPAAVPIEEWTEATEAFANLEYDIGDLCLDAGWDDDVDVLEDLRKRFDRLVALCSR